LKRFGEIVESVLNYLNGAYQLQAVIDTVNAAQELEFDDLTEMMQNTSRFVDTFGKFQVRRASYKYPKCIVIFWITGHGIHLEMQNVSDFLRSEPVSLFDLALELIGSLWNAAFTVSKLHRWEI
jgi:hypothetical protein